MPLSAHLVWHSCNQQHFSGGDYWSILIFILENTLVNKLSWQSSCFSFFFLFHLATKCKLVTTFESVWNSNCVILFRKFRRTTKRKIMKYGKLNVNEKLKKLNVSVSSFFPPYYKCSGLSAILQPIPFLVTCRDLLCLTFPFHLCFVVTKIKSFIHPFIT